MDLDPLIPPARLIPVVGLRSPAEAEPLARALRDLQLPIAEVTLRSDGALASLAAMAQQPGIVVGAGTVRTPDQLVAARDAGARFIVSPCLTPALIRAAADLDVPYLPGVATATELQCAVDAGYHTVKLFPAEAIGGIATVRALAAPFPDVRFVPTGGITAATAGDYLAHPQVLAVGGSWMVP